MLAVAGLIGFAALLGLAVLALVLQAEAHRVQGAADLAALTGAQVKKLGTDDPCAAASRAAAANEASMAECRISGDELSFAVSVTVRGRAAPAWLGAFWQAPEVTAHAGLRR